MLNRRDLLENTVRGSSLVALASAVPSFVAATAQAAETNKERVLVVLELTGGNDGLNTVVPYGDDLYYKARPTLAIKKEQLLRVDDHLGLHPSLMSLRSLVEKNQVAIIQGVGYPNPNRSHFDSMDIWHRGSRRRMASGWIGRAIPDLKVPPAGVPAFHISRQELPLALQGGGTTVPSLNSNKPFGLDLIDGFYGHAGGNAYGADLNELAAVSDLQVPRVREKPARKKAPKSEARKSKDAIEALTKLSPDQPGSLLQLVRKTSLDTYTTVDRITDLMNGRIKLPNGQYELTNGRYARTRKGLLYELTLVARMIRAGFGTRVFYVSLDGFDTHGDQLAGHAGLLRQVGQAISTFFNELKSSGDDQRVVLMTFSEFGRRVRENGSKGTDHGAGSNMFVIGPKVQGGVVGEHPSLKNLSLGDLKYHTDFRRVYATLLDGWLGCDSRRVLGEQFKHLRLFS